MQTRNRLLDDLARVATGALGVASGVRREAQDALRGRFGQVLDREGLVTREEFDAVKAMAAKARAENELLAARLEALEAKLARTKATRAPRAKRGGNEN